MKVKTRTLTIFFMTSSNYIFSYYFNGDTFSCVVRSMKISHSVWKRCFKTKKYLKHRRIHYPTLHTAQLLLLLHPSLKEKVELIWCGPEILWFCITIQATNVKKKHISTVPAQDWLWINAREQFCYFYHHVSETPLKQLSSEISVAPNALNSGKADPEQPCLSNKMETLWLTSKNEGSMKMNTSVWWVGPAE